MATSFERGLRILAEVAATGDVTVDAVASKLGIPSSSAYRYFKALREQNFVIEEEGHYRPGQVLLRVAGHHQA